MRADSLGVFGYLEQISDWSRGVSQVFTAIYVIGQVAPFIGYPHSTRPSLTRRSGHETSLPPFFLSRLGSMRRVLTS